MAMHPGYLLTALLCSSLLATASIQAPAGATTTTPPSVNTQGSEVDQGELPSSSPGTQTDTAQVGHDQDGHSHGDAHGDAHGDDHIHLDAIPAFEPATPNGPGTGCAGIVGLTPAPYQVIGAHSSVIIGGRYQCDQPEPGLTLTVNDQAIPVDLLPTGEVRASHEGFAPGVYTAKLADTHGHERAWQLVVGQVATPRLFGDTRTLTATAIADRLITQWGTAWHETPRVIIINGEREADAMAATTLADQLRAPILITGRDALPPETIAWLQAHPKAALTLVGGNGVISPVIEDQLKVLGTSVTRFGGETRYATAAQVAQFLIDTTKATKLVIADASRWQDALPAAVYAARQDAVWMMADPKTPVEPLSNLIANHPDLAKNLTVTGSTIDPLVVKALVGDQPVTMINETMMTPLSPIEMGPSTPPTGALSVALAGLGPQTHTHRLVMTSATNPIDGITAGPLAALNDGLVLADVHGAGVLTQGVQHQKDLATKEVLVIGGPKAVSDPLLATIRGIGVDAPVPSVEALKVPTVTFASGQVQLTAAKALTNATVYVQDVHGVEIPGTTTLTTTGLTWKPQGNPSIANPVQVTAMVVTEDTVRHISQSGDLLIPRTDKHGWIVAPGVGPVVGDRGTLYTWVAAVEPGTGWSIEDWTALAESVLNDKRGWTYDGKVRLQRVDTPERASIRVVLAKPATVDAQCAMAGLRTGGRLSCWNGRNAMINLDRVNTGVPTFDDLNVYRTYVISHEFGHGLGHGHITTPCKDPNQLAPVMMQQSKHLLGCKPNGWPFPHAQ